ATSNFSAASISASAACCGVLNPRALAVAVTAVGFFFASDGCAMDTAGAHRHAQTIAPTIQRGPERFPFGDVDFILCSCCLSFLRFEVLPAPPTTTAAAETSAASRSHAGGTAATAAASARSVVAPGT